MWDIPKEYLNELKIMILNYGGRFVGGVLVLILGFWVTGRIVRLIRKAMERRDVDPSLRPFLLSLISIVLKVMIVVSVLSMIGLQMTSFIAIIGSAGLAIGLALQGSLSNFAGGVLILLLKPFKVGDFIDTGNHKGTVREIRIFYTYMTTFENQEIIIPNGQISNNSVINYSYNPNRRLDMTFGISYSDDIDKAKKLLQEIIEGDQRFLADQPRLVFVISLGDSSVNLHVRAWLKLEDYWDVTNNLSEHVKKSFDANGVTIPFPQRQLHMTPAPGN